MPEKELPLDQLQRFLPPGTSGEVTGYLHQYKIHLTITRERKSILGNYRHRTPVANHRISVNGNLNPYAFLVTLLHEIAHLLTFEQYGNRVQAHGKEWKMIFGKLMHGFVETDIFPGDIKKELLHSIKNPAAGSCAEDGLLRALRKYDVIKNHHHLVEELAAGSLFKIKDGRVFQKGAKLRKRFKCKEIKTGKLYLFSPVYEVEWIAAGS